MTRRPRTPLRYLPTLALAASILLSSCGSRSREEMARALTGGDPAQGKLTIRRYGCPACHEIPGIAGADGLVGPSLDGISNRVYVAGVLKNTPENLIRWLQRPRHIDSLTAMPEMGVTDRDARDIAGYLYTLD